MEANLLLALLGLINIIEIELLGEILAFDLILVGKLKRELLALFLFYFVQRSNPTNDLDIDTLSTHSKCIVIEYCAVTVVGEYEADVTL